MTQPDQDDFAAWEAMGYERRFYSNGGYYGWEWRRVPWYVRMWRKWRGRK